MRLRARLLTLIMFLLAGIPPAAAAAQGSTTPERVEIALWPEYDRPAMLVIVRVTLPAATTLPTSLVIPIPASVGEPTAVAKQSADGSLLISNYTRQIEGDLATIRLGTDSLHVQVEYYDSLAQESGARRFAFTWPSGFPTQQLAYEVQQPVGGSGMQITPAASDQRSGADGLTYYRGELGSQDGRSPATVSLAYNRSMGQLTVELLTPATPTPGAALSPAQPARAVPSNLLRWVPWLIGGLGVLLLAGGGLMFLRSNRTPDGERRTRHRSGARQVEGTSESIDASPAYCHNCGTQAGAGDVFCRHCGTRLRPAS
jgi:hypothetical protein